jgi:hypothetical protein
MNAQAQKWQAHEHPNFDVVMTARCDGLLIDIARDQALRMHVLTKPQWLHEDLYRSFTPTGYQEYAGTYRGTENTSLAGRTSSAASTISPGEYFDFCAPEDVSNQMALVLPMITRTIELAKTATDYENLIRMSRVFGHFGQTHPFLDGNGHVQRSLFAAMATELGYPLSPRFAIHPRPYDSLLAVALEFFTVAPLEKRNDEAPMLAEYLSYFLQGPFSKPRAFLG